MVAGKAIMANKFRPIDTNFFWCVYRPKNKTSKLLSSRIQVNNAID